MTLPMNDLKQLLSVALPRFIVRPLFSAYHFLLAFTGAVLYVFPSKDIRVIAVTGTKVTDADVHRAIEQAMIRTDVAGREV